MTEVPTTVEAAPEPVAPPVRRIRFEYPQDVNVSWIPARPEFACAANSISLLMPHMEPYFVRSVKAVVDELGERPQTTDTTRLLDHSRAYVGQEAQHHRQHRFFNDRLVAQYRGLAPIERRAAAAYGWLGRSRSTAFNMAFVAASETIAYSAARWSAERRMELFTGADPVVASLFLWHLAEEVEHKSIAWDLHRAAGGGRWRYARAALAALLLVMVFVGAGTAVMLWAERRLFSPLSWVRLGWWAITFAFELLPNLAVATLPGHHPDQLVDPLWYEVWLREHDAADGTAPLWNDASAPSGPKSHE